MGNSLYQIVENGEIKVHLYPLTYPFFSPLVVLYLLCHLFPSLLLYHINFCATQDSVLP